MGGGALSWWYHVGGRRWRWRMAAHPHGVRFKFVEKSLRSRAVSGRRAWLRARQLGQAVVSSSRRLPRSSGSARWIDSTRAMTLTRRGRGRAVLLRRGRRPTVAREHVRGPDVLSTTTVKGAREGARVEIMSVGCPRTAVRASRSAQASIPTVLRASGSTVSNRTPSAQGAEI